MAAYKLTDFIDIINAVMEELKLQSSDTTSKNRIKRAINMMYLDEVVPASRWNWLYGHTKLRVKAYYSASTCSVTPGSATVTLAVSPTSSVGDSGSFLNWKLSIDGDSEVYTISAHTALSTTITLGTTYNGALNAIANYKIWQDWVALPTDARETIDMYHDHQTKPMEGKGLQEMNRLVSESAKIEGRPYYYSTQDWYDPSGGLETEADRYRIVKFHPSISTYNTIVNCDYVKETAALDGDGDEPLMSVEDRIVLFYGALSIVWGSIGRNPEEASRNRALFDNKLARMMGKIQDAMDKPRIEPSSSYMASMRGNRIKGLSRRGMSAGNGGSGTAAAPSYLENVTINGAIVTGTVTASAGITIDGRDLSVDGAAMDAHIAASDNVHGIGATASVVGTDTTQTLSNKTIDAGNNTITSLANANIDAAAAIARSKLASGTASVVLANDGTGVMSETAITATELTYLDDVEALTSVTLTDNTAGQVAASWAVASFNAVQLQYSIKRATAFETGLILLTNDATNAAIAQSAASLGTLGVTLTVDISAGSMRLLSTTTSTGTAATLKYKVNKWLM